MTRRRRIFAALFAVLAIVFAQLSVAAHACDVVAPAKAQAVVPGHECCNEEVGDDGNSVPSGVCVLHCHYGEASFDGAQPPTAIVDASGPVLRVDSPDPLDAASDPAGAALAPPAAAPPATIFFGVLRI
ncbi:MAG: hypothetical protein FIB05_01860 [Betaproteobacteria bacterium]|nr:hypothetical protein [Betaproteobacteria bacterium]